MFKSEQDAFQIFLWLMFFLIISALYTSNLFLTSEALVLISYTVAFDSVHVLLYVSRLLVGFYIWIQLVDVPEHSGLVLTWLLVLKWCIPFSVAKYSSCLILWIRVYYLVCFVLIFYFPPSPCLEQFMLFAHLLALSIQLLVKCRSVCYTCSHSCEGFGSPYLTIASWSTVWIWNVELKWLFLCYITYKSTFQDVSVIGNPATSCSLCVLKHIEKS